HLEQDRADEARNRITPLLDAIVQRAKNQGTLRDDFDTTDIIFLQYALGALIDRTRQTEPALYRRYLTMLLDGSRADCGPKTNLPVSPLSAEATQATMSPHHSPLTPG